MAAEKEALKEARRMQEERAQASIARQERLENNDNKKLTALERGVCALESAADALATKLLPDHLPDVGDWLATKNLGELAPALQEAGLDLKTLLQTAADSTPQAFDMDFKEFVPTFGKRRKLLSEAKGDYARLAKAMPPTPPPPPAV